MIGEAQVSGHAAPGFERVAEAFERNFGGGVELGAGFAAYVDGELVVDMWGGLADARRGIAWDGDTLVPVFSGTKGLVAICLLVLIERGSLELDAPVCHYWPEFAAHGKEEITVRDVVSHQARLPGLLTPVTVEEATDDRRMAALLADQAPLQLSGPRYHALTFGWLCGELVRRVDGRSVGRFLREEIAEPLGVDVWIGLPVPLEPRVAVVEPDAPSADEPDDVLVGRDVDEVAWSVYSNPPRFAPEAPAANMPLWHAAEVPGSNGIVSARGLARLYGCLALGGELDGVRVLDPATIAAGLRPLAAGCDPYIGDVAFGTGLMVQTSERRLGPPQDAFGHPGAGGSMHGAWPSLRTGFSYTPNRLAAVRTKDCRARALLDALHAAVD
jgi:CubicO group peptidase (beta-lactamase class C family)